MTSYVMALKTKKNDMSDYFFFFLERVKKKCDGACSTLNLKVEQNKIAKMIFKTMTF